MLQYRVLTQAQAYNGDASVSVHLLVKFQVSIYIFFMHTFLSLGAFV